MICKYTQWFRRWYPRREMTPTTSEYFVVLRISFNEKKSEKRFEKNRQEVKLCDAAHSFNEREKILNEPNFVH